MPEVIEDVRAMSDDEFMERYEKLVYHFVWKKLYGISQGAYTKACS
ncbi:hypothetical protein [Bacillus cereus]